jgi:signal transduction histidine kinase
MRLYLDRRVLFGFVASLATLVALGYFSYRNNQLFVGAQKMVFHTNEVLFHIEQTNSNAVRIEELLAKYVVTGDSAFILAYRKELQMAGTHYRKLLELTKDNEVQQRMIDSLRLVGREKLLFHRQVMEQRVVSRAAASAQLSLSVNEQISLRVDRIIDKLREEENILLQRRMERSERQMASFQITFFVLMGATLLILGFVFVTISRTMKARLRAEAKTRQINQELEAFTYSVSHDLRAPLRSIRGFAEVMKDEYGKTLDEEGNRLLSIIMRNAGQMGQLIDDLLDFSRIGRKELTLSRINMNVLVEDVVRELEEQDALRKITWKIHTLEEIRGDISMMKQVWINLLSNAVKYSRKQEAPVVEVGSYRDNGAAVFFVKDNGVGFDMQYQDKLFKVFQRLHGKEFEGTGVGLALVHRIVSRHQGRIWAEAQINEGATFFFSIK